jgi:hypothetical protein
MPFMRGMRTGNNFKPLERSNYLSGPTLQRTILESAFQLIRAVIARPKQIVSHYKELARSR